MIDIFIVIDAVVAIIITITNIGPVIVLITIILIVGSSLAMLYSLVVINARLKPYPYHQLAILSKATWTVGVRSA